MGEDQEKTESKNIVTIKDAGPCRSKVSVEVPEDTVKAAVDEQYDTLGKESVVPGFRKGRAPRRLLEKRFGKEVSEQIKLKLLADASESAVTDNDLKILRDPDIDHEQIELPESGSLKFEFEVDVRPQFDLPKLEGIKVNKTKAEVTDDQVKEEIEQLRKYSGIWAPREDGAVETDDQIIADAILKIEGVEEEEKHDNTEIFVRANGFVGPIPVEKLDELMIGAKEGEKRQTTVEIAKTFVREDYRGKKIDVEITVKEIKWLKPADLDEDFFSRFGVENEAELDDRVRDMLEGRLEQQSRAEMTEQVYKYLLDKADFDLPVSIVAEQASSIVQREYINLIRSGLSREQIAEQTEQLQAGSEDSAKEQLKTFFLMEAVADKLEIKVSEEEINGRIAQIAIQRGQRPEQMREQMEKDGSLTQFSIQVCEEKCIAKLLESAEVSEVKAKKKKAVKAAKNKPAKKETVKKETAKKKTTKKTDSPEKKVAKKSKTTAKKKTSK